MADTTPPGRGMFSSSLRALRRLQTDFATLNQQAEELTLVLLHMRRPVADYKLCRNGEGLAHFDYDHDRRKLRLTTDEIKGRELSASWQVPDDHATLPGTDRWFYLYSDSQTLQRLHALAMESARLVWNVVYGNVEANAKSMVWPDTPECRVGLYAGYWYDLVFEFGRWRLESAPIQFVMFAIDDELDRDGDWVHDPRSPDIWTNPNQPPGWELRIERFASASVNALELLIEWGETGRCPWGHRLGTAESASTQDGNVRGIAEWRPIVEWIRDLFIKGEEGFSEDQVAIRFHDIPGIYNLLRWLEAIQVIGAKRGGTLILKDGPSKATFNTVQDYREIFPGILTAAQLTISPGMGISELSEVSSKPSDAVSEILRQLDKPVYRKILVAMLELDASPEGVLVNANLIASRAIDSRAGAESIKREMVMFKTMGLVSSSVGRGKGSRLTVLGMQTAERIKQSQNSSTK